MISFRRWLAALAVVAVVSVGVVALVAADRPAPPPAPPTIPRRPPDARPALVSTSSTRPASNVYLAPDGRHCFGMDPAEAERRGIEPHPACQ